MRQADRLSMLGSLAAGLTKKKKNPLGVRAYPQGHVRKTSSSPGVWRSRTGVVGTYDKRYCFNPAS